MTVRQLMKKLIDLPPEAQVIIANDDAYNPGAYVAKYVLDYTEDENFVEIATDYKKKVD